MTVTAGVYSIVTVTFFVVVRYRNSCCHLSPLPRFSFACHIFTDDSSTRTGGSGIAQISRHPLVTTADTMKAHLFCLWGLQNHKKVVVTLDIAPASTCIVKPLKNQCALSVYFPPHFVVVLAGRQPNCVLRLAVQKIYSIFLHRFSSGSTI